MNMASSSPRARKLDLVLKALALVNGVIELGVGVGDLRAIDEQLEPLRVPGLVTVRLGKWRHLHRVVRDEGGLHQVVLALLSKDFVDQFALAHGGVCLNT